MSRLRLNRIADPSTAPSTKGEVYLGTDNTLKFKDDAAVVHALSQGYRMMGRQVIQQGTVTYTPTTGCNAVLIQALAGGGSGGNAGATAASNASAGAGGGGGGYAEKFLTSPGSAGIPVVVGQGGANNASGAGIAGNDTTFNATVVVAKAGQGGGAGGAALTAPLYVLGGAGGLSSSATGDIKIDGEPGSPSQRQSGTIAFSGAGGAGAGPYAGGGAIGTNVTAIGANGLNYGSGGAGAILVNGGAANAGGNGGNGVLVLWEFA